MRYNHCWYGDAWLRLVHGMYLPKFRLLAVSCGAGAEHVTFWARQHDIEPLQRQLTLCDGCVDPWTATWLRRLSSSHTSADVAACLASMVALLPCCSAQMERKNLLGQEAKDGGRRGNQPTAATLGTVTYCKLEKQRV